MRTFFSADSNVIQCGGDDFRAMKNQLIMQLKTGPYFNRGRWQAESVEGSSLHDTRELHNVTLAYKMPSHISAAQKMIRPDLPWAENHFLERVSGEPLNPAPSYVDWPYHSAAERDRHLKAGGGTQFDHTYPERMWPKEAGRDSDLTGFVHPDGITRIPAHGVRFEYGDLGDVVTQLRNDPFTRQAYLPIFFPEDTGATTGQRVPCTIGYHFIRRHHMLDCYYTIRSCDLVRHFTNDVYMAVRLTQWVVGQLIEEGDGYPWVGNLNMTISNLHVFRGDEWKIAHPDTTC